MSTRAARAAEGEPRAVERLRLAVLTSFAEVTGPGRQLVAAAARLHEGPVDVRVFLFDRARRARPPLAGLLDEAGVPCTVLPDRGPLDFALTRAVCDHLRAWPADLVQTHGYKATAVAWWLRRRGLPIPWLGFYHGATTESLRARFYHRLDRRLLSAADRVAVMSSTQAALFPAAARTVLLYNAALDEFTEAGALPPLELPPLEPPVLGVVGRLSPEKGVDVFLDACARLRDEGLSFTALLAGDGPTRERLVAQCQRLGLADRVRFLGHVDAVRSLYRSLDLLVIPSRSEGLPNVLLEALAGGVPAVATRVGAIPDVLRNDAAGAIVPPGDPAALAAAIRTVLARARAGEFAAGFARVLEPFSLAERVRRHVLLYRELCGAVAAPATSGATQRSLHGD